MFFMIRHRDVTYVEFGQEGDCDIKFSDAYGEATLFFCPCPASSPPPPPPPSLAIEPHKSGSGSSSGTQTEIRGKYLFLQVLYLDNGNYVSPPPPPFLTNYVYFMEFEFISPPLSPVLGYKMSKLSGNPFVSHDIWYIGYWRKVPPPHSILVWELDH